MGSHGQNGTFIWSIIEYENKIERERKENWNDQKERSVSLTLFKTRCSPSGIACFGIAVARMEKPNRIWRNMSARIPRRPCTVAEEKKGAREKETEKGRDRRSRNSAMNFYEASLSRRNTGWSLSCHGLRGFHISKSGKAHPPPPSPPPTRRAPACRFAIVWRARNARRTFGGRCSRSEKRIRSLHVDRGAR